MEIWKYIYECSYKSTYENININLIKTHCYLVICCWWAEFQKRLQIFFVLLQIEKYYPAKHCLWESWQWRTRQFQSNLLQVSRDRHRFTVSKNRNWKLNTGLGAQRSSAVVSTLICTILVSDTAVTDIHMYSVVKFRYSSLNVSQNPWHSLLGSTEMAMLSALPLFFPHAPPMLNCSFGISSIWLQSSCYRQRCQNSPQVLIKVPKYLFRHRFLNS